MKHVITTRWLANQNQGSSIWPYSLLFESSYEYLIYYQSEDSHVHQMILWIPQLCWLLSLECLSYFEHTIQSLLKTCLFGIRSWKHIKPHTYLYTCAIKIRNRIRHAYSEAQEGSVVLKVLHQSDAARSLIWFQTQSARSRSHLTA